MSGDEFLTPEEKSEGKPEGGPENEENGRPGTSDTELLAVRLEAHRARLRAVAYRMPGSLPPPIPISTGSGGSSRRFW